MAEEDSILKAIALVRGCRGTDGKLSTPTIDLLLRQFLSEGEVTAGDLVASLIIVSDYLRDRLEYDFEVDGLGELALMVSQRTVSDP